MASPVTEPLTVRKLQELRVIDLKAELERRGLEKTGVKASLTDRLRKALEDEGNNAEDYTFELDMKKVIKSDSKGKGKSDGEDEDCEGEDADLENGEADETLTEEPSNIEEEKTNSEQNNQQDEEDIEQFAPEDFQVIDDGEEEENLENEPMEDDAKDQKDAEVESTELASVTETTGVSIEKIEDRQIEDLEPPSPSDVPVLAPFTSEDTIKLGGSTERQMDEDLSLIVHVDESQMELDNDLLGTPAKKVEEETEEADEEAEEGDKTPGRATPVSADTAAEVSTSTPSASSDSKPATEQVSVKEETEKTEGTATTEAQNSAAAERDAASAQSKDGDQAKSKPGTASDDKVSKAVPVSSRNLWISGLAPTTRATDLKTLFTKHGKVAGAKVVTNAKSPGSRCYGFVTMSTAEEASKCIQHLHRTELHGKMISVERAKTDPSAPARPTVKQEEKSGSKDHKDIDSKDDHRRNSGPMRPRGRSREPDRRHSGGHRRPSPGRAQRSPGGGKNVLDFEKIKAERERERIRQRERMMREEERRRLRELERMKSRQNEVERRQREEQIRLDREKQRLRLEQQRLERERLEAERERISLERERQRRERERLEKEREQERLAQLRMEQERRAMKRNFENRGPPARGGGDEAGYWNDPKRPNLDRKKRSPPGPAPARKYEERSGPGENFERRVERYDRREARPVEQQRGPDRFENRREERHEPRREAPPPQRDNRDRDDRARAEARPPRAEQRYERYEERREPPAVREHERPRHDRDRSPHGPPHRGPPPRSTPPHRPVAERDNWKGDRAAMPPPRDARDTHRVPPSTDRGFVDSRAPATGRDGAWHANRAGNPPAQVDRSKPSYPTANQGLLSKTLPPRREPPPRTAHLGSQPGSMDHQWNASERSTVATSQQLAGRPSDRGWPSQPSQAAGDRVGVRPQPAAIPVQQPLLQTPPTSAAFLASAANIMMGVNLAGNRGTAQDTRYDAYKNIQGGTVRRY